MLINRLSFFAQYELKHTKATHHTCNTLLLRFKIETKLRPSVTPLIIQNTAPSPLAISLYKSHPCRLVHPAGRAQEPSAVGSCAFLVCLGDVEPLLLLGQLGLAPGQVGLGRLARLLVVQHWGSHATRKS